MKKIVFIILTALFVVCVTLPLIAMAETYEVPLPAEMEPATQTEHVDAPPNSIESAEPTIPGEPLTWSYLATIAGASALTLLIVQFLKVPLDSVFHIPTRILVYLIALAIMLVATALTTGLTVDNALLVFVNAIIAAVTAYGAYEVTFARSDSKTYVSKDL